jgi:hypothetical protein
MRIIPLNMEKTAKTRRINMKRVISAGAMLSSVRIGSLTYITYARADAAAPARN